MRDAGKKRILVGANRRRLLIKVGSEGNTKSEGYTKKFWAPAGKMEGCLRKLPERGMSHRLVAMVVLSHGVCLHLQEVSTQAGEDHFSGPRWAG